MNRYIGFTGLPGSGKSELIRRVEDECIRNDLSCSTFSLSDELRDVVRARGLNVERKILNEVANQMRITMGNSAVAQIVYMKIEKYDHHDTSEGKIVLIDAIRTPEEIGFLKRKLGSNRFKMVAVQADLETIAERLRSRARADEGADVMASTEKTLELLWSEAGNAQPSFGLNISGAMQVSDMLVDNSGATAVLDAYAKSLVQDALN